MGVRILHSADLHLDSAFEGLPADKAAERRERQFAVLSEMVSKAETYDVQAILLCGDLFDRPTVSADTAARTAKILAGTAIPVLIAPGNHDYFFARSPYNLPVWPGNVHIFRSGDIECVALEHMTVYGAAFTDPSVYRPVLSGFHITTDTITEGLYKPSVMALHGEINPPSPRYNPISPADIAATNLDYLALGHIHQRTEAQKAGRTVYAYCGCPEGRGFDETGQKGAYLVEFGKRGEAPSVRFLPLGGIRYAQLSVDLTGRDDPTAAVLEALPADSDHEIYRITLTGECAPERLSIRDISQQIAPSVYYASLSDQARLPRIVWVQAGDDTLAGLFLSLLRDTLPDAADDTAAGLALRLQVEAAARFGLAALNGEEAPPR